MLINFITKLYTFLQRLERRFPIGFHYIALDMIGLIINFIVVIQQKSSQICHLQHIVVNAMLSTLLISHLGHSRNVLDVDNLMDLDLNQLLSNLSLHTAKNAYQNSKLIHQVDHLRNVQDAINSMDSDSKKKLQKLHVVPNVLLSLKLIHQMVHLKNVQIVVNLMVQGSSDHLKMHYLQNSIKINAIIFTLPQHSNLDNKVYNFIDMKYSSSLPSLMTQSKLFPSEHDLEASKLEFRNRLMSENSKMQSEQRKPTRSLIHFQENIEGFTSFRSINNNKIDEILGSLKTMKSANSNIGKIVKAQILFNKRQYSKIEEFCENKKKSEKEAAIIRLAKLEPLPMKNIKMTEKNKKKIKTTVGIKMDINYAIYENNRLAWKPYFDFDAMGIAIGKKAYFIGGRQSVPLCYYDRDEDKWSQQGLIEGLKPFGESEATLISNQQIVFFGGSKFFVMGESVVTNSVTYVNLSKKTSHQEIYDQTLVPPRCFHAQCKYGEYLIISGGIDRKNKLLNNFTAFNFVKKFWFELTISKIPDKLMEGFAKHRMMPIFYPRKKYNLYEQQPITSLESQRGSIKQEGIYIFGGEDANVQLSNRLYILTAGKPSIEVIQPQIKGKAPEPRKNFDWVRIKQFLFIHGGRNDQMRPWVLNKLNALNLRTLNWLSVKGEKASYRHSHILMATRQDQIVILGGKNMEGLCKEVFPMTFQEIVEYI